MTFTKRPLSLAAGLLALAITVMPAHADDLLSAMEGSWSGSGLARVTPDAQTEPLRCRLSNSFMAQGERLTISGRCATPGQTTTVEGWIEPASTSGSYRGQWMDLFGGGTVAFTGSSSGNTISTQYTRTDRDTGQPVPGWTVWNIDGTSLTVQNYRQSDGRRVETGRVDFQSAGG